MSSREQKATRRSNLYSWPLGWPVSRHKGNPTRWKPRNPMGKFEWCGVLGVTIRRALHEQGSPQNRARDYFPVAQRRTDSSRNPFPLLACYVNDSTVCVSCQRGFTNWFAGPITERRNLGMLADVAGGESSETCEAACATGLDSVKLLNVTSALD